MQNKNITILSTRPLPAALTDEAAAYGIHIESEVFIETAPIQSVEVQQEVEQALLQSATVIFTSMNAVEAVAGYMNGEEPQWSVYCIGQATRQLVQKYFGANCIAGTADNATDLAALVASESPTSEVIFFCGDQRRDELPDILRSNDMEVTEIVVYQTIALPHTVQQQYNGILFFSPSAVHSFFSANTIKRPLMLFAIGNTTAAAIKKYTDAGIIVSNSPAKASMVEKLINYFVHNER